MYYQCYLTHDVDDVVYEAPEGYTIESFANVVNSSSHGSSNVTLSPNRRTLSIHAEANGKICFEDTFGCVNCPDEWQKWSGSARRQVQVNLVSTEPTRKVGEEQALMVTTRGLCCCATEARRPDLWSGRDFVVDVARIPERYQLDRLPIEGGAFTSMSAEEMSMAHAGKARRHSVQGSTDSACDCDDKAPADVDAGSRRLTIRQANELGDYIKTETIKTLNNPRLEPQSFVDTEFFARQLELELLQLKEGRRVIRQSVSTDLPKKVVAQLEKHFGRNRTEISRRDLLSLRNTDLARMAGISESEAQRIRLKSLGVEFSEAPENARAADNPRQTKGRRPPTKRAN